MSDLTKEINKLLKIEDSYQAPDRLLEILYNKEEREKLFVDFLHLFRFDVTYDWFHEYFQDEHADRKTQKQDFTPNSIGNLLSALTGPQIGGTIYDPCAGTGGLTVQKWDYDRKQHSPFEFKPHWYLYHCEELSSRAIPFLLFNLLIRGMNAVVIHCDVISRKAEGAFFVQNDYDDHMKFSSLNLLPYSESTSEFLRIEWKNEKYKPIIETKEFPEHLLGKF